MNRSRIQVTHVLQAAINGETTSSLDRPQGASTDAGSRSESDEEPGSSDAGEIDLSAISGTKCRVPHSHEWGEKQHCNALILGVESLESDDTPKVRMDQNKPGSLIFREGWQLRHSIDYAFICLST